MPNTPAPTTLEGTNFTAEAAGCWSPFPNSHWVTHLTCLTRFRPAQIPALTSEASATVLDVGAPLGSMDDELPFFSRPVCFQAHVAFAFDTRMHAKPIFSMLRCSRHLFLPHTFHPLVCKSIKQGDRHNGGSFSGSAQQHRTANTQTGMPPSPKILHSPSSPAVPAASHVRRSMDFASSAFPPVPSDASHYAPLTTQASMPIKLSAFRESMLASRHVVTTARFQSTTRPIDPHRPH